MQVSAFFSTGDIAQVSRQIDALRHDTASLQAVLRGDPTREDALNAQRLVGPLRTATVLNELAVREAKLGQLARWATALAKPIGAHDL